MNVALAADGDGVGQIVGGDLDGLLDLAFAPGLAFPALGPRQSFDHVHGCTQHPKVLQRNFARRHTAKERIDVAGADRPDLLGIPIEKQAAARQPLQRLDGGNQARGVNVLHDLLAALGLERQRDRASADLDVGFQQRDRAPRARQPGVPRRAGADPGRVDQRDRRGHGEFARRLPRREHAGDVTADARQRVDQADKMSGLPALAHLFPIWMITVLPPACGIAAHGLQRRRIVFGIDDIGIGRRHRKTRQAFDDAWVCNPPAVLAVIAEAASAAAALDGQTIACGARRALGGAFDSSGNPRRHASSG